MFKFSSYFNAGFRPKFGPANTRELSSSKRLYTLFRNDNTVKIYDINIATYKKLKIVY